MRKETEKKNGKTRAQQQASNSAPANAVTQVMEEEKEETHAARRAGCAALGDEEN
jgi:hypothetical protein